MPTSSEWVLTLLHILTSMSYHSLDWSCPPSLCSTSLGTLYFHLHSIPQSLVSFLISSWAIFHSVVSCSIFMSLKTSCSLVVLLIASSDPWKSDRMQFVISIFLYMLKLALCLSMGSVQEKFPDENCWNENIFFFALVKHSVRSVLSFWSMTSFSSSISQLSFWMDDLSIT